MRRLRELFGLPVLEIETGTQIGEVREVVLDSERACVLGIVISGDEKPFPGQGIFFRNLFRLGLDAVMVKQRDAIQESLLTQGSETLLGSLLNKATFTETGRKLGTLVDVFFDPVTGEIKGYELSDGIITDLIHGRRQMPLPQAQVIGADNLIVPETMASLLQLGRPVS